MDRLALSFELFPPRRPEEIGKILDVATALNGLDASFISVTYGAGGSSQNRTVDIVRGVAERGCPVAGHLTCAGAPRAVVDGVLEDYRAAGVRRVVILRGDSTDGIGQPYRPHPDGYPYASDLLAAARRNDPDLDISVGCYPETHPEARGLSDEIEILKRKFDAGANRGLTQFFFEPEMFLRYRDAVADAGIEQPIVPGIMLQRNFNGLARMARLCGAYVPQRIARAFDGLDDDIDARDRVTVDIATQLCLTLQAEGVNAFHFYTMNRASLAAEVCRNIAPFKGRRAA